ncbi:MAG: hypothetical protein HZB13_04855 [Acidobacteria bacterium]|nr:hypothetical protein [Acidobacteriota bacterium]
MKRWQDWLQVANLFLLALMAWMLLDGLPALLRWRQGRSAPPKRPEFFDWVDPAKGLQIIMFYGSPGVVEEGQSISICYGVANARTVRIDPPVDTLSPSLNTCLSVTPVKDTRYTLTAEDGQGKSATASFDVKVKPDSHRVPRIEYFSVRGTQVNREGSTHLLCFSTWNAELVEVDPPAFPSWKLLQGCFYVAPKEPTTYTLTAHGTMGRKAVKQLKVQP